jgi:hypothetical protein
MTSTTTTASRLRIQLTAAEDAHDAALQAIDDAQAKLHEERVRPQEAEAELPAPDIQPARWARIARMEFEIERAKREAKHAADEVDRVRTLLVAAERKDSATLLAKLETAAAGAAELDQRVTAILSEAIAKVRDTIPEARKAANEIGASYERLPLDVRPAVSLKPSRWSGYGAEQHLAHVAELLGVRS